MVVICEQCGRKFPKPCKLKYHIDVVHLKLRNFKCEYCEESCANVTALKYHIIRKHSDDRDYACEDCDRTFKTQSGLDQHYQTHDKGKIFTCLECGMELKKRTSYQYHLKKHEKVLDTICAICGKQFSDYLKMKEHTYNMHRKNPQIPCAFCNKKYYMQVSLDRHLANHAVFSCDLCGQKFLRRSDVTKHIQQHLRDRKESNKIIYASKIRISKVKKLKVQKLKGERFKKNMQGIDDEGSREYTQLLDPNEIQNFLVMEIREEQNPLMIPQELVEIKEEPAEISDIEPVEVKQEIIEDKDLLSELGQIQFENILLEPPNVKTLKVSPQKKIKNFKLHRKGKKFENKIIKLEVTHNVKLEDTVSFKVTHFLIHIIIIYLF